MMWSRTTGAPVRSGTRSGKTHISKKGNHRIRRVLHLPAFNAVRYGEPACQALFERVYQRTGIKPGRRSDESVCGRTEEVIIAGL
ncbi:transposase [Spirosoma endophyticum]|uniref:transposase n=1 Tax=Spirosoma endophyticum TaxID=662367 RepID=UPI00293737F6|nr:transposase [Spirosoma endophyticum]